MSIVIAFALVAIGIVVDAYYQHCIRKAECDAYETGYQQGLRESKLYRQITVPEFPPLQPYDEYQHTPTCSMAAPVAMPPTFEERLRTHGKATAWVKGG